MPVNIVDAGPALAAGLKSTFNQIYRPTYAAQQALLGKIMRMGVPSERRDHDEFFFNAAPHPDRWDDGEAITTQAFDGTSFEIINYRYAKRIEWYDRDARDDQTKSLADHAGDLGRNFALLDERAAVELITNTATLLPAIPNAADGVAMYSGAARFGNANGNIVAGTGVATPGAVRSDFFNGVERILSFQDQHGQPKFDASVLRDEIVIMFNSNNLHVFSEAFAQGRTTGAVGQVSGGAATTNVIMDAGYKILPWPTPRLTDNDWLIFLTGPSVVPAMFQTDRQPLRSELITKANSDKARTLDVVGVQWELEKGHGITIPINTVQINN